MNKVIVHINKEITPFFNYDESDYEEEFLDVRILINGKDLEIVTKEIDKAFDNWTYDYCEGTIIRDMTSDELCGIPVYDYILMWLDELNIKYVILDGSSQ